MFSMEALVWIDIYVCLIEKCGTLYRLHEIAISYIVQKKKRELNLVICFCIRLICSDYGK